jgi:hypothetical protein
MTYHLEMKCEFSCSTTHHVRIFLFFSKVVVLKVVHPLKICQHTKFYGPTLSGAVFSSASEV